jgi:hypothetical protein
MGGRNEEFLPMSVSKWVMMVGVIGLTLAFSLTGAQASNSKPKLTHPITGQIPNNTYVVTKTTDSGDNTNAALGTLRRAMVDANKSGGFDAIVFDITGSGVKTITVKNYFPDLTDNAGVMIDGTQSDDRIEIDGSGVVNHYGISIVSDNNVIKGLIINGVKEGGAGIGILNGSNNNVIVGNFIGTNAAGTASKSNHSGVFISNNSNGNYIGGTNGVTPGGSCTGDCNLLSGNRFHGVVVDHSSNNVIKGNFIGTNANGNGAVPNNDDGVLLAYSSGNTVGGTTPQERNVISGNTNPNVEIGGNDSHHNKILGNYIGTNSAGTAGLANGDTGILVDVSAHDNLIDGNVISGHPKFGVLVFQSAVKTTITNNRIGIAANSDANLGNKSWGIEVQTNNNYIASNRIGNNTKDGIRVKKGVNNGVRFNEVFNNGNFGINLGTDAFTPNDGGDGDGGANYLQNFPTLNSANLDGGTVTVAGNLNSRPNTLYNIDFFWNPACDVVFGKYVGEGKEYLGSTTATTNSSGNVNFNVSFGGVPGSGVITSSATDGSNNTSEMSPCVSTSTGPAVPPPPQLLTPSNGESVGSNPPWLDWSASNGATYYKVMVRQDYKKGPKVYVNNNVTATDITPNALEGGHTYYWSVKACNTAGCKKSTVWTFTIP